MGNSYFRFKEFTIQQDACAMKVTTDACLFGAWCAHELATSDVQTLLDAGSGTGLLSLMISQKKRVTVDAVEIDTAAAAQARQNVAASPWNENITMHNADILNMGFTKRYDCIISNPPFYEKDLRGPDEKRNTAHHSRQLTLNALVQIIATNLNTTGVFFLLLPYKRRDEAIRLLNQHNLFLQTEMSIRQTDKHSQFRIMLKGSFAATACRTAAITIASDTKQYTPQFAALLKGYYLYL
jgi:tRNA1Val (adenine37-N6)-methyltransferase